MGAIVLGEIWVTILYGYKPAGFNKVCVQFHVSTAMLDEILIAAILRVQFHMGTITFGEIPYGFDHVVCNPVWVQFPG